MDLLGNELVLSGPGDVFYYLSEEALGPYELYEVELFAEPHAAFLKYSLSSVLLTTALLAAPRGICMENFATNHRLASIKLSCIVVFLSFVFE